jgi:glycosyltransferase involved in cell wall biosynthesis
VQKHNLKKSNFIITDSAASRKDIEHIAGIPSEKIEVAYLAAADEFRQLEKGAWRRDIREKYNLPEKFALYVGDVTWNKNVPNLMKAVKEANITLVMVGRALSNDDFDRTNPWNSDLVKVNELLRNDLRFIRLGFLPTEDLVALYNLALVFVFPSVYEGFGLPILEAMQSGCPVVTTKGGSIPEVAGDGAYMVDGYNTKSIAKGISDVFYNYQLRDELIVKGLTQAKKFSWQKTAEKTIEAYKKALK